jgi:hypothetical protein
MKKRWKNKGARAAWIYYQLRLKETSAAGLGRGMTPPASRRVMSYVINGSDLLSAELTRRVQEAVAEALGVGFKELWGKAPSPKSPLTPLYKGGEGEGDKGEKRCA